MKIFFRSPLFAISKPLNQNKPWSRHGFDDVIVEKQSFAGNVYFCGDFIHSVFLYSNRSEFYSENEKLLAEKELKMHCFHKNFLKVMLGSPHEIQKVGNDERDSEVCYNFSWGLITAAQDMKSGFPMIFVKYGIL